MPTRSLKDAPPPRSSVPCRRTLDAFPVTPAYHHSSTNSPAGQAELNRAGLCGGRQGSPGPLRSTLTLPEPTTLAPTDLQCCSLNRHCPLATGCSICRADLIKTQTYCDQDLTRLLLHERRCGGVEAVLSIRGWVREGRDTRDLSFCRHTA